MERTGGIIKTILLICFFLPAGRVCSQNYKFLSFKSDKELPQPYVYSILQDAQGFLWIGTGSGLSKYNGFEFENYTSNDSLADDFITCGIRSGKDLWFGHMNGRITCYHDQKFIKVNAPGRELSPVTHLALDPGGNVWFSTYEEGLFMLDARNLSIKSKPFRRNQQISTFEFVNDHEVLIGTPNGLILCNLSGIGYRDWHNPDKEYPESKITGIQKKRKGQGFYVSTENDGIFLVTINKHNFRVIEINPSPERRIAGVQHILEDSQSDLWIATIGDGLIRLNFRGPESPEITYFNKAGDFLTDNVKTVFEDREGIIWSGNYGDGLTRIIPSPFSHIPQNKEIYGNNVTAVFANGSFQWIATEKGLLKKDGKTGNILKFYNRNNGLPDDHITTVFSANGNDYWIGTSRNGLFFLDERKGTIKPFILEEHSMASAITKITGRDEKIWVGTHKGLCLINTSTKDKTWFTINQGGLPHNFITSLYLDKKGTLWVSTNSSTLACIRDEKVTKIGLSSGKGLITLGEADRRHSFPDLGRIIWKWCVHDRQGFNREFKLRAGSFFQLLLFGCE